MISVNRVTLLGNVGNEPEVKALEGGKKVAKISVATTEKWKDESGNLKEETTWHDCEAWNGLAEVIERYVKKGTSVYVEGRIRVEKYTDKDGINRKSFRIRISELSLLGGKEKGIDSELAAYINSRPDVKEFKEAFTKFRKEEKMKEVEEKVEADELPF